MSRESYTEDIKICPYCQSEPSTSFYFVKDDRKPRYFVCCVYCNIRPACESDDEDIAVEAWNDWVDSCIDSGKI